MAKRTLRRTLGNLDADRQSRLRNYIAAWPMVDTTDLADDLWLRPTTVAAVRAHITREAARRFNKALGE